MIDYYLDRVPILLRSETRYSVKHLYYHYMIQILRHVWKMDSHGQPHYQEYKRRTQDTLFCGRSGRHLPKNMLLALVEKLVTITSH